MQSLYQRIYETIGDTEPVGFRKSTNALFWGICCGKTEADYISQRIDVIV